MSRELISALLSAGAFVGFMIMRFAYQRYVPAERREAYKKMSVFDRRRYLPISKLRDQYGSRGYTLHFLGGTLAGMCAVAGLVVTFLVRGH